MDKQIEMISPENLRMQVEGITNYDKTFTPGANVKKMMVETLKAKSRDLFQVKPSDITVVPGYNPRVHNRAYFEGIEELAEQMKERGYYQDKPLACYIAKIDGEDKLVLQDGHRRHAAACYAIDKLGATNIKTVPVVLKERGDSQVDLTLALLHSNEGQPFTTYEKAVLAKRLKTLGWENKQIAAEFKITPAAVGQLLQMAGASQAVADLIQNGNLSATEYHRLLLQHGHEEAERIATEGVARAQAEGRTRVTAKDLTPSERKEKNAKKHAFDLYKLVKALRNDPTIEKRMSSDQIEAVDGIIADIEKRAPAKVEKPAKPAAKKGKSIAAKIAENAEKGSEIKTKASKANGEDKDAKGFFNRLNKEAEAKKAEKAQARKGAVPQRRSDR